MARGSTESSARPGLHGASASSHPGGLEAPQRVGLETLTSKGASGIAYNLMLRDIKRKKTFLKLLDLTEPLHHIQ